ncbi:uncharacterized protein F4812DRAFT_109578 [Daldinia caldariorum]|uniref:uncharacterized protein n=1 Tax=Daldinia caldariorum TaxID=326644 RepID=UPI002008E637|nr:uncharacterized protein F4812DRAFT_109578 [Daldinia caldariorum]KAI1465724.1 hypothetical protein F4812DRAFT_109578 [Daldinia caldariorum]
MVHHLLINSGPAGAGACLPTLCMQHGYIYHERPPPSPPFFFNFFFFFFFFYRPRSAHARCRYPAVVTCLGVPFLSPLALLYLLCRYLSLPSFLALPPLPTSLLHLLYLGTLLYFTYLLNPTHSPFRLRDFKKLRPIYHFCSNR